MKNIYEEPVFELSKFKFEAILDTIKYSKEEDFASGGSEGDDDIIGGGQ